MPLRKITKAEYKGWITEQILAKIEEKNKLFKEYINCKNPTIKDNLHIQLKEVKNEVTTITRQSKKEYYNRYFTENARNLQKIWKGIKQIISIKSKNYNHPTCIIEGNNTLTNPIYILPIP